MGLIEGLGLYDYNFGLIYQVRPQAESEVLRAEGRVLRYEGLGLRRRLVIWNFGD